MSCWMKQLILDTNNKEIHLYLSWSVAEELHITSHWFDYYKTSEIKNLGNWNGFSDWTTPVIIVWSPNPVNCWKREVTSISVYNPNPAVVFAYVAEYDDDTGDTVIIDQIILNPMWSWTLECICDSCNSCGGVNIYDEWQIVYNNINNINFVWDCISANYNPSTWHVDVMFSPVLDWSGCEWENPYILSLCWASVDLSCLADPAPNVDWSWCDWVNPYQLTIWTHVVDLSCLAWGGSIDILQDGVFVNSTTTINFQDCLAATWNAPNNRIDVEFTPTASYNCDTKLLTICGEDIDMFCERRQYWYVDMQTAIPETAVMNNWLVILTNTINIELPIIPITAANLRIVWAIFYVYNAWPVVSNVLAAAWVTIANNPWTIGVDETIWFMIKIIGTWTRYLRIS